MRCKVGDIAVVVDARNRCNLGAVVRVIELHDGSGDIEYVPSANAWIVEAPRRMKWTCRGKTFLRKLGPVPDAQLQPIRDEPIDVQVSEAVKTLLLELSQSPAGVAS